MLYRLLRVVFVAGLTFHLCGCPGLGSEEPLCVVEELPDNPTFADVKPVLDKYCNECHAEPATQDAPDNIRLDVCEDTGGDRGAKNQAFRITSRTIMEIPTAMPPDDYPAQPCGIEEELLDRWANQGAACDASEVGNDGMALRPTE